MKITTEEALRFVAASFPSAWALELLLLLKSAAAPCSKAELVERLRASDLVVTNAIDALVRGGLVSFDGDAAAYLPVSGDVADLVNEVEALYISRPNAVRRAIITANRSAATAFADAFKFRKDDR